MATKDQDKQLEEFLALGKQSTEHQTRAIAGKPNGPTLLSKLIAQNCPQLQQQGGGNE